LEEKEELIHSVITTNNDISEDLEKKICYITQFFPKIPINKLKNLARKNPNMSIIP